MLNKIWAVLMIVGILASILSGKTDEVIKTIISSANDAVTFSVGLIGTVALWSGIIKILENAKIIKWLSKQLKSFVVRIFPSTHNNEKAQNAIITNISANFLGLGNGATPSGIEAVKEMDKNIKDICLFLVINSAGIQLIPSTVIAMRAEAGAVNPTDIILPTWIVSVVSLITAIAIFFVYYTIEKARKIKK